MAYRRAQVQIGEMVMILAVVFVIATIGLVWYTTRSADRGEQVADEDLRVEVGSTARFLADLPELKYALAGNEDATVIDWYRANAFTSLVGTEGRDLYRDRFNGYRAEITCVLPCTGRFGGLVLFDYTPQTSTQAIPFTIPALLYDPVSGNASFGTLTLTKELP